jgi:hypothetical protein
MLRTDQVLANENFAEFGRHWGFGFQMFPIKKRI